MTRNGGGLRTAILDEARKVLLDEGYTSLSMRRIASAVGCTPTSIYLYFRDKDDLIHTLIDEGMERLQVKLENVAKEAGDPIHRIELVCRRYVEFGVENPEYYEIMFLLHPKHMERYPAEKYRRARRNLEVFAEAICASDGRKMEEVMQEATVIWTSLHGMVSLLLAQRIDVSLDRGALIDKAVHNATQLAVASNTAEEMDSSQQS